MVREAETNADEDKKRKEEVEIRNNANSMVHASDRVLKDLESKMSAENKTKLQEQRDELEKALKENASVDSIKTLSDALQQTMFDISSAAYQQEGAGQATSEGSEEQKPSEDDVIDAEYSK